METIKKNSSRVLLLAVIALVCSWAMFSNAGNLNPWAPPGPTMKTLDEVEARIPVQSLSGSVTALFTISQSGSYYLTGNISGVVDKHGIEITVSDVTIDLNGYALIGPGMGVGTSGHGINATGNQVTVLNGSISGWRSNGINLTGEANQVFNLKVRGNNGDGIYVGMYSMVNECSSNYNEGNGIQARQHNSILNCTVYNNSGKGIYCLPDGIVMNCVANNNSDGIYARYTNIRNNTTNDNSRSGIYAYANCLVISNVCFNNSGSGIRARIGNTIRLNSCTDNDTGLQVDRTSNYSAQNTFYGNTTAISGSHTQGSGDMQNISF